LKKRSKVILEALSLSLSLSHKRSRIMIQG
jgi:hypothetical protein